MNQGQGPSKMKTEATAAQADVPELDLIRKAQAGDTGPLTSWWVVSATASTE
jgi:hypothetical protein